MKNREQGHQSFPIFQDQKSFSTFDVTNAQPLNQGQMYWRACMLSSIYVKQAASAAFINHPITFHASKARQFH